MGETMRKWEYCAITGIGDNFHFDKSNPPRLLRFSADAREATHVKPADFWGVARTIAELGDQGWEMVSSGSASIGSESVGIFHTIYFRKER